ncbi:MAG: hypothetical protein KDA73_18220 [Rhodobacteraceae bacterium]|nr:hypothetical protein [Paracoccaceae bacterium]
MIRHVHGTIEDPAGKPERGALVEFVPSAGWRFDGGSAVSPRRMRAYTDNSGHFEVDLLDGDYDVAVTAKDQTFAAFQITSPGQAGGFLEPAAAPNAFAIGDWDLLDSPSVGGNRLVVRINAKPAANGAAVSGIEYRVGGGTAQALPDDAPGDYTIAVPAGAPADVEIRADSGAGPSAWSDLKTQTPSVQATAPAAFAVGDWGLAPIAGDATHLGVTLNALPGDGGDPITAVRAVVNGGAAQLLAGLATDGTVYAIAVPAGAAADVEIYAVNGIDIGAPSDTKTATPWMATATAPTVAASDALAGRVLTISIDSLTGSPAPAVTLTTLTLDGMDVLGDAVLSGSGAAASWAYTVPDDAAAQDVVWEVTAANGTAPDAIAGGSETVAANLFAPASFAVGDWGLAAINGDATHLGVTLNALPDDGGDPITEVWSVVNGGAPGQLAGLATDGTVYAIAVPAGAAADVEIYAVNGIDIGAPSDTKTATPWVAASTAPTVAASDALAGRVLTISIDSLTGSPAPAVTLTTLTLDGADVSGDAVLSGSGAGATWTYTVPDSAAAQDVVWEVTAANGTAPDATAGGSETVAANLFAPAAFAVGDWDLAPINGDATHLAVTLNVQPDDGGQATSAVYAEIDSGSGYGAPVQLGGLSTGVAYAIPVLADTQASVRIWAENGITPVNKGPAKTATPWVAGAPSTVDVTTPDGRVFTFSNVQEVDVSADGIYRVIGTGVTLDNVSPLPYETTPGNGEWRDGIAFNQRQTNNAATNQSQTLDARSALDFQSGYALPSFPRAMANGESIISIKSSPEPTDVRAGLASEIYGIQVYDTAPAAGMVAQPLIWWPGKPVSHGWSIDLDALDAALPLFSEAGVSASAIPTTAEIMARFDKLVLGHALSWSTNSNVGYQMWIPNGFTPSINYGETSAQTVGAALLKSRLPSTPAAERKALLLATIRLGAQHYDPLMAEGQLWEDGGHNQFLSAPMALFLYATGRTAELATLPDDLGENIHEQPIRLTTAQIAKMVPFTSDASAPQAWRRRTVISVSGQSIFVDVTTEDTTANLTRLSVNGARIIRESDSEQALVLTSDTRTIGTVIGAGGGWEIVINGTNNFAPGDVIYFDHDASYTPAADDVEWAVTSGRYGFPAFLPGVATSYRVKQNWAAQVLFLYAILGLDETTHARFGIARDWVIRMANGRYPQFGNTLISGISNGTEADPFADFQTYAFDKAIWDANTPMPTPLSPDYPGTAYAVTGVTEFSRDRTIFDTGAALGQNALSIPVPDIATDAPDGTNIRARAINAITSAQVFPWRVIGQASGGVLTGASFDVASGARNPDWLLLEFEVEGSAAASHVMTNRFGAGHIVMVLGQSEDARMFDPGFDYRGQPNASLSIPTLTDDDAVQVVYQVEGGASSPYTTQGPTPITTAAPVTPALAHMADVLTRNTTEKWLIVDACHSGTSPEELANDSITTRNWSDLVNLLNVVRADGADVGLVTDSWTAAPSASGDNWRLKYYPFYLGIFAGGSDYTLGTQHPSFSATYDHILFDLSTIGGRGLFDAAKTRLAFHGPHRFEDGISSMWPLADPAGTYAAGYTSNDLNAGGLSAAPWLHVVEDGGAVTLEGSNDQSSWNTVYSGTPAEYAVVASPKYTWYRITTATGGRYFLAEPFWLRDDKQDTRASIRNLVDDAQVAPVVLAKGPEMLLYQNGYPASVADTAGGGISDHDPAGPYWLDGAHPSAFTDDGLPARARHTAVAALYGLGLVPHEVPVFNRIAADPAGAWVDLWFEASDTSTPAITTTRLARGLPALTQDQPHRTEVWGFRINAEPAENVTINAGKVRILPNASMSAFTGSDTISYGKGGATGIAVWPEDEILNGWMNLPMIDMGLGGIEGVAVEPMPLAADIAIPLSGTPQASTANGAWFVDPATFGSAGKLTEYARLKIGSDVAGYLFYLSANYIKVERLAGGSVRILVKDYADNTIVGSAIVGSFSFDPNIWYEFVLSIDLTLGTSSYVRLYCQTGGTGGFSLIYEKLGSSFTTSGVLAANRQLSLLATNAGASALVCAFSGLQVWKDATGDATLPAGTPHKQIDAQPDGTVVESGTSATAWLQGTLP